MSDFALEGIVDSTLREGEQRAGVVFDCYTKLKIVDKLVSIGIEEIEVGVSTPRSPELLSLVPKAVKIAKGKNRISLWCRCHEEDIFFAHRCNPDSLSLSMPVSDILIREKLARNHIWVIERLERSISTALSLGFGSVSVGLEDATRADPEFLFHIIKLINDSGVSRLRFADTVGVASPGLISDMVKSIQERVSIPVGVHTHNDFGMATANAIAALEAGARWVDATVLGLGERTGNCRLEEIVGYLTLQKNIYRYGVNDLKILCDIVAKAANTIIHSHHPVIGEKIFTCESGLHVQALAMNPEAYEPYDPLRLGHNRKLLFGSKTGRRAVQKTLNSAGMNTSKEQAEDLVNEIRFLVKSGTKPLVEKELIHLARERIINA
jgi:homocitrate synthase NifV